MSIDKNNPAEERSNVKMQEINQDLENTRRSVAELLRYREEMMTANEKGDVSKINEYRRKAISAINHLFEEDLNTEH